MKKLIELEKEYESIKARLEGLGDSERLDVILEKIKLLEIELKSDLSRNKRTAKTIW